MQYVLLPSSTTKAIPPVTTTTTTVLDTTATITEERYLAEAVYGEYSQETDLLRDYRDSVSSKTPEGKKIIRLYYEWSPVIVKVVEENEELKKELEAVIDLILHQLSRSWKKRILLKII